MLPPRRPQIRVLSIDGGIGTGISVLLILRPMMLKVAKSSNRSATIPALPSDYFDLIVGTGTGGTIAIMLGRLRMSVDQCIDAYKDIAKVGFQRKSWLKSLFRAKPTLYNATNFENAIKQLVRARDPGNPQLVDHSEAAVRTAVVATRALSAGSPPQLLRSYTDVSLGNVENCLIWQAARATTAASIFFKPITINHVSYVDGAMGSHNNPVELAYDEAREIWPDYDIGLLLSIGTGSQAPIDVRPSIKSIVGILPKV